jgi:hypothetical protein
LRVDFLASPVLYDLPCYPGRFQKNAQIERELPWRSGPGLLGYCSRHT